MTDRFTPRACGLRVLQLLLCLCATLMPGRSMAAAPEVSTAPTPAWVTPIAPSEPATLPKDQLSQGIHYLLLDTQIRVDASNKSQYRHLAIKALSERGVETAAQIEISFDPSYQRLVLHMLQVRRGAQVIQKLARAAVKVLQREKELDYLIFDGSKSANIFLDDVRVGDTIEYAYSVLGSNPVFGNRQFGRIDLQWNVPVHEYHTRLLWPQGRALHVQPRNLARRPATRELGPHREYVWQETDVAARVMESDTPDWYDPYPSVQWGEFQDWQSVARWAVPYYRLPAQLSPALRAEVERIARANPRPAERLLAALHFVQREIRYLGVEIGPGSHAPSSPQQVLDRRFGDCKDKSLLTMTLLHALGIEARAALVHTTLKRGIRETQPSPYAFNHVLVRAQLGGHAYWIDPTRAPQKGDLAHLYQPDYEAALVVDDETRDLVAMTGSDRPPGRRSIHARFDAKAGFDQPVGFTVTTTVEGAGAENMRNTLATENRDDLQKRYLNFYARYYPQLTIVAPMKVEDDEIENRLTLTEQYRIDNFWQRADGQKRLEATIATPDLDEYLRSPRQSIRENPLALTHPVDFSQFTEVWLPEAWDLKKETRHVVDPSFEFERTRVEQDRVLTLIDNYRSRSDSIAPTHIAAYAAKLDRARNATDLVLYKGDAPAPPVSRTTLERFNWPVAMLAVLLLAGYSWLALKFYRHDPPAVHVSNPRLQGIGGWLLLPALSVVLTPIRLMVELANNVSSYAADTWSQLTTVGAAAYHPMWAPTLLFEVACNLAILVFSLLLLVMFFQKRRGTPLLYICVLFGITAVGFIDLALMSTIPSAASRMTSSDWKEPIRALMMLAVWGTYFLRSERVKATFVNGPRARVARPRAPSPAMQTDPTQDAAERTA